MREILRKSLNCSDEKMLFEMQEIDTANFNGFSIKRLIRSPGWSWEKHLKPISKTNSCQSMHILYVMSGQMLVVMINDNGNNGSNNNNDNNRRKEKEIERIIPNDIVIIPPGHREWVVGDSLFVAIDFVGAEEPRNNHSLYIKMKEKTEKEKEIAKLKTTSDTEC